MTALPAGATRRSYELLGLGQTLADACPEHLAREIALTGSAARGWADEHSDIELDFWVDRLPERAEWEPWLHSVGATDIDSAYPLGTDGWKWTIYRFRGVWVEMGFATIEGQDELLTRITAGQVTEQDLVILASMVRDAVSLRTGGWLDAWKRRLETYPDGLAARIIRANTSVWADRHTPPVRWALADRNDLLGLSLRLQWDISNLFRVLFAANRTWEPDMKWLAQTTAALSITPDRLTERIGSVLTLTNPHASVAEMFRLILEMLALVPEEYDVSKARESVLAALRSRTDYPASATC
jgi:hypothetical protein